MRICHEKQENLKALVAEQRAFDKKVVDGMSEVSLGEDDKITPLKKKESLLDWFKLPKFYLFGMCYMCVRMYTNLFGTILPFYLTDVLQMTSGDDDEISYNIALVPMLAYAASVVMSSRLDKFYTIFGRKKALFAGTAILIACQIAIAFLTTGTSWVIYILAFFIGIFFSIFRCFSIISFGNWH